MNKTLVSAKNFVVRNQTKILVTALVLTTTVAVIEQTGIRSLNQFLKDHDLFDAYYNAEL